MSKGRHVLDYFPGTLLVQVVAKWSGDVVKNVASPSFEIRKLVYIYLIRHAEQEPDVALLSVNTFQKGPGFLKCH